MIFLAMVLFAASLMLKSITGKAIILALSLLMLVALWVIGSFGGLLWGLCIATVTVAGFGLARSLR